MRNVRYCLRKEIRNRSVVELGRRNSGFKQRQEEVLYEKVVNLSPWVRSLCSTAVGDYL